MHSTSSRSSEGVSTTSTVTKHEICTSSHDNSFATLDSHQTLKNLLLPTCTVLAILTNMYPNNPHIITWSIDSTLDLLRDAMELVSQIIFDLDRHTLTFGGNAALVARLKIYPFRDLTQVELSRQIGMELFRNQRIFYFGILSCQYR